MQTGDEEEEFTFEELNPTDIDMSGYVTDTIKLVIENAEAGSIYDDTAISEIEVYGRK